MFYRQSVRNWFLGLLIAVCGLHALFPSVVSGKTLSDAEIAREIVKENNRVIIEAFLKYELGQVNTEVTLPLLKSHPSLVFFIKQAERGPLKNLLFLEEQVHKLRDAQKNINSVIYSIAFPGDDKKKIMELRPVADRIVSYGIPLTKRDFYRVVEAARALAEKRRKHPVELIPKIEFRNEIFRYCEPTAEGLDREMGKLSEGELVCMRLGWVLEEVTVTSLWLRINDNDLPIPKDYMAYRAKRSQYFQKRLKQIYGEVAESKAANSSDRAR